MADVKWKGMVEDLEATASVPGWGTSEKDGVQGVNVLSLFGL